jgi:acetoin utilization deacetylase AcuC-like enzyme
MRMKRRIMQVENPDRLNVLIQPPFGVLLSDFFMERFIFRETPTPACLADILRVHDFQYVEGVKKICDDLKKENKFNVYKYDSDTCINQHSWDSAIYAAGSVIDAVDQVMSGEYNTAFCLVRPPGHHAGYFGKVE